MATVKYCLARGSSLPQCSPFLRVCGPLCVVCVWLRSVDFNSLLLEGSLRKSISALTALTYL